MSNLFTNLDLPLVGTASIAALGLTTGLRALAAPADFAATFGVPQGASVTGPNAAAATAFIPATGARNIAGAATLLSFCYLRDRRAVGVTLVCGVFTGLADGVVCYYRGIKETGYAHAGLSLLIGSFGVYMLLHP